MALKWIEKAVRAGYADAQRSLSHCDRISTKIDDKLFLEWLEKATSISALLEAQYELGNIYSEIDPKKAFEWFKNAAEMGHANSQYRVAQCYEKGKGVEYDEDKAEEWFKKAVEQGHPESAYEYGQFLCGRSDPDCLELFLKAANLGNVKAYYWIGLCLTVEFGVDTDNVDTDNMEAIRWFKKAEEHGFKDDNLSAAYELGSLYEDKGEVQEAIKWYKKG